MNIKSLSIWLGMLCLLEPAAFAQQQNVSDALRDLQSRDWRTKVRGIAYLKEHYSQAKVAMIAALDCDAGPISDALGAAFAAIGKSAVADLIDAMPRGTKRQKVNLAGVLGQVSNEGKAAVPVLHALLSDKDPDVRAAVVSALGKIQEPTSVPLIAKCLRDKHFLVRISALSALFEFGPKAHPATADIIQFVKDDHGREHDGLETALLTLGRIGRRAIPSLEKEIMNPKNPIALRQYFLGAIGRMGSHGAKGEARCAIPTLRQAIGDKEPEIRTSAFSALSSVCYHDRDINPDNQLDWFFAPETIKRMPTRERVLAASTAAIFKKHRMLAIAWFDEGLRSSDATILSLALGNCLSLNENGAIAGALVAVMKNSDDTIRQIALERVTSDIRFIIALPTLLDIIKNDRNASCRRAAATAASNVAVAIFRNVQIQ